MEEKRFHQAQKPAKMRPMEAKLFHQAHPTAKNPYLCKKWKKTTCSNLRNTI